jgi:DNA (cytosine-5)-methyltransferase 1
MNHLDMCSGIGGWALAFRELGINTVAFCEIDKYPQQVLQKNFPNIPIFNDLKELTYEDIKETTGVDDIDLITCSYPCQPFSVAGKQKGEEDPRHLWPDTFRIVQECKPTWFVGENVSGHIKLGLDTVLEDLASEGYDTRTFIIPASSVGAWHKRERLWIIGYSEHNGSLATKKSRKQGQNQAEQSQRASRPRNHENVSDTESLRSGRGSGQECRTPQWQFLQEEQEGREVWREAEGCSASSGEDVSNTSSEGLQGLNAKSSINESQLGQSTDHDDETGTVSDTSSSRLEEHGYSEAEDAFQFTAEENWWQAQSELCGVPDGISYELDKGRVGRIKGLGNAIVPQIAWFIGHAIISVDISHKTSDNG